MVLLDLALLVTPPWLPLAMVVVLLGLLGFLYWNRHRARLFMGDCGSLFIGSLAFEATTHGTLAVAPRLGILAGSLASAHLDCPGQTVRVLVDDPTCGGVS